MTSPVRRCHRFLVFYSAMGREAQKPGRGFPGHTPSWPDTLARQLSLPAGAADCFLVPCEVAEEKSCNFEKWDIF